MKYKILSNFDMEFENFDFKLEQSHIKMRGGKIVASMIANVHGIFSLLLQWT